MYSDFTRDVQNWNIKNGSFYFHHVCLPVYVHNNSRMTKQIVMKFDIEEF